MLLRLTINHIFELFAGPEEGDLLGRNFNAASGFGITCHAGLALARAKAAEATDLDFVASSQRPYYPREDGLDDEVALRPCDFREPGNFIDQICLSHLACHWNNTLNHPACAKPCKWVDYKHQRNGMPSNRRPEATA
jgi:hypothetical protein